MPQQKTSVISNRRPTFEIGSQKRRMHILISELAYSSGAREEPQIRVGCEISANPELSCFARGRSGRVSRDPDEIVDLLHGSCGQSWCGGRGSRKRLMEEAAFVALTACF
jgi:hypothetical protein